MSYPPYNPQQPYTGYGQQPPYPPQQQNTAYPPYPVSQQPTYPPQQTYQNPQNPLAQQPYQNQTGPVPTNLAYYNSQQFSGQSWVIMYENNFNFPSTLNIHLQTIHLDSGSIQLTKTVLGS